MAWQYIRIARFGDPEVLELAEQPTIPDPGPGEVRIKVLAAGTGFTDTFIRRGRYPDFKGPSRLCAGSPQGAREELASMQPSMRLAARISRGLSLASHPAASSSATVPRQ